MNGDFQKLYSDAVQLLHQLTTPHGILASTIEADNYKRIWARDSIVCGIAGLWIQDEIVMEGLKNSLLTLAKKQHSAGMIPSNVLPDSEDISFGSLVGRIDATTWFIVGSCLYYQKTRDQETWAKLQPSIEKCRIFLKATEFNDKGWIYTPLSGNWADEYPIHGYTLYDNALRLWGEQLYVALTHQSDDTIKRALKKTEVNFWPRQEMDPSLIYQKPPFQKALQEQTKHFSAFILPGVYDQRFDAAGNALALLLFNVDDQQKRDLSDFITSLQQDLGVALIPAFWPIITERSDDWNLLAGNYSFDFKNSSGDFHNGGIWTVWMGLLCYALSKNGLKNEVEKIIDAFIKVVRKNPNWAFQEYFNAHTLQVAGKTQMGYTASGIVFMKLALEQLNY
jgi:Alkaline and neutral invertase